MLYMKANPTKETNPMSTYVWQCRRCKEDLHPGLRDREAYGVEKANGQPVDRRTRAVEYWLEENAKSYAGPYCRNCATKRQDEYLANDRRTAKRELAEQVKHNVEADDCTLIAAHVVTGKAYSTVRKHARALGYGRKGTTGLHSDAAIELIRRCGGQPKLTAAGARDAGIGGNGKGATVRQILNSGGSGKYVAIMQKKHAAHIVAIDLDAPGFTVEDLPRLHGRPTACSGENGGRAYNIPGWTDVPAAQVWRVD